jgi:hypothetical protein
MKRCFPEGRDEWLKEHIDSRKGRIPWDRSDNADIFG